MHAESYVTKKGQHLFRPVLEPYEEIEILHEGGWCLGCGCSVEDVEPDARKYTCDSCGQKLVYGLEELVLMGLIKFIGEEGDQ